LQALAPRPCSWIETNRSSKCLSTLYLLKKYIYIYISGLGNVFRRVRQVAKSNY
jgi:hypothetical protein